MWDIAARHAVPVALVAVLATVTGAWGASFVGVQTDFVDTVPHEPSVEAYRDMIERLDGVRFVAVYMPSSGPDLRQEGFDALVDEQGDLTAWLHARFPGTFSHTLSAWEAMRAGNYMLEKIATSGNPRPEAYAVPDDPVRYEAVKRQTLEDDSIDDVLAQDGSSAILLAFFSTQDNLEARRLSGEVAAALGEWDRARADPVTAAPQASGLLVSSQYTDDRNAADLQHWGLVAAASVAAALLLVVRRPANVLLVLAGVVAATVWTFGIMGAAGIDISFLTLFLAPIVIGIGVDHGVHVLHRVEEEHGEGLPRGEAVARALRRTGPTVTVAAWTTAAGLAAVAFVPNPLFSEIAAVAAAGILLAWLAALTLVPALAALLPGRRLAPARGGRLLGRAAVAVHRHPAAAWIAVALVTVAAAAAVPQARVESGSAENEFPQDDPVIQLQHRIEAEYGAFQRGYLIVRGDLTDPAALQALHDFSARAAGLPLYRSAASVADLLLADEATDQGAADILAAQVLGAAGQAPGEAERLPQTREEARQRLDRLFSDPLWRALAPFTITQDYSLAVVAIQVDPWDDQRSLLELRDALRGLGQEMQAALPDHDVQAAGAPLNRAAIIEQTPANVAIATLGVAAAVGVVLLGAWRRRGMAAVRVAGLGVLGVLLAALWLLATVPALDGLYRATGSANSAALTDMFLLAFAITVAVGVDDLVHLAARYWEAREEGHDAEAALREAWTHAGRAVTGTSLTTFVAFAALVGVYFLQSKNLAILTAAGVAYAYAVTLLLAPFVLTFRDRSGRRSARHSGPTPPTAPRTPPSSPAAAGTD